MTKASDNVFPKIIVSEEAAPATPAAGTVVVYAKADGLVYSKDDVGTETLVSGGAGGGGGGTPTFVGAKAFHSTTQSIATNTTTGLSLDSEEYDTDAFHDTATNNSRFTVPAGKGGYYLLLGGSSGAALNRAESQFLFRVNGTTLVRSSVGAGSGNAVWQQVHGIVNLSAGDYVELVVYQNSGSPLSIGAASGLDNQTWASVTLLGA